MPPCAPEAARTGVAARAIGRGNCPPGMPLPQN
eukprot:CAMPEP_0204062746 /NCGR_PEP_ID=MMETSP0360-20130528/144970_1 /ASSEMBLY_ACC=CAM_ASM_000342 /TAXON_ID=268821 /ORGANISM="Scrippsiella Hangoei, Strain SHTV-5" /LENGTH=32 /DNA_ID= /DNA_START= /DNA_END= /DNA_ORIENTATION=